MRRRRIRLIECFSLLLFLGVAATASAQQFTLQHPTGADSVARFANKSITIIDAKGQTYVYNRERNLDTPGFKGYYNAATQRGLRWPMNDRGRMELGRNVGGMLQWSASQMTIAAARPMPVPPRPAPRPTDPRIIDPRNPSRDPLPATRGRRALPTHVAATPIGREAAAAYIDDRGDLQIYQSNRGRWTQIPVRLRERLEPGASLVLIADRSSDVPIVYTTNDRGDLIEILEASRTRIVNGRRDPQLPPGAHLTTDDSSLYAADVDGLLWEIDPLRGTYTSIDRAARVFDPGIPMAVTPRGDYVFAVERSDRLVVYERTRGGWSDPVSIGRGFNPGGHLAATMAPLPGSRTPLPFVAAFDDDGRTQVLHPDGRNWVGELITRKRVFPGASLTLANIDDHLSLSAVWADGSWIEFHEQGGRWEKAPLADGFSPETPVALIPGPYAFAVDRAGRLSAAEYQKGRWVCSLCGVDSGPAVGGFRPQEVVPNPVQRPVNVFFVNSSREELAVRLTDLRTGENVQLTIAPGAAVRRLIDRDSGGVLQQSYSRTDPFGRSVSVRDIVVPPKSLYSVAAYANRTTSLYFDRTTNKGPVPDQVGTSLVSIGAFVLPAGTLLQEGDRIDVYGQARLRSNPGAVVRP